MFVIGSIKDIDSVVGEGMINSILDVLEGVLDGAVPGALDVTGIHVQNDGFRGDPVDAMVGDVEAVVFDVEETVVAPPGVPAVFHNPVSAMRDGRVIMPADKEDFMTEPFNRFIRVV